MAGEGRYASKATALAGSTPTASVPADPRRVWIGFTVPGSNQTVKIVGTADNGVPFTIVNGQLPLVEFWFARHGPLVSGAWTHTLTLGQSGWILELLDLRLQPGA